MPATRKRNDQGQFVTVTAAPVAEAEHPKQSCNCTVCNPKPRKLRRWPKEFYIHGSRKPREGRRF